MFGRQDRHSGSLIKDKPLLPPLKPPLSVYKIQARQGPLDFCQLINKSMGLVLEPRALIARQTKSLKLHATIILQFRYNPLEKLHSHCAALSSTICICCPGSAFICILVSWGSHPYIWLVTRLFEGWARKIRKLAFWECNAASSLDYSVKKIRCIAQWLIFFEV